MQSLRIACRTQESATGCMKGRGERREGGKERGERGREREGGGERKNQILYLSMRHLSLSSQIESRPFPPLPPLSRTAASKSRRGECRRRRCCGSCGRCSSSTLFRSVGALPLPPSPLNLLSLFSFSSDRARCALKARAGVLSFSLSLCRSLPISLYFRALSP